MQHNNMSKYLTESFRRQVCYLLEKAHVPRVAVRPSEIPGAGNGVFYQGSGDNEEHDDVEVLCLYPGIYTPPLPLAAGMLSSLEDSNEVMDLYLAKKLPPSGIDFQENAYVLNLGSPVGGYLDGCALETSTGRPLNGSPSACGHLVNHFGNAKSTQQPNVQVVPFFWKDILPSESHLMDLLPNTMRCDGSPWYFEAMEQRIIYFPEEVDNRQTLLDPLLAGAAIVASRGDGSLPLHPDQELLLDYQLQPDALPKWAVGWYQ